MYISQKNCDPTTYMCITLDGDMYIYIYIYIHTYIHALAYYLCVLKRASVAEGGGNWDITITVLYPTVYSTWCNGTT